MLFVMLEFGWGSMHWMASGILHSCVIWNIVKDIIPRSRNALSVLPIL